jgi:anti-sigma factor RsiW
MNDCPNAEVRDRLPDFVHGALDATAEARVASHLRACADCAAEVELLRLARAVLRSAPRAIDVGRITAALPSPLAREGSARRSAARRFAAHRWRTAAAVLVVAGGAAAFWLTATKPRVGGTGAMTAAAPAQRAARGDTGSPAVSPVATTGLSLAGSFEDLTDEDLSTLLEELHRYEVFPDVEPETEAVPVDVEGVS